jgi:hypothetical protein
MGDSPLMNMNRPGVQRFLAQQYWMLYNTLESPAPFASPQPVK